MTQPRGFDRVLNKFTDRFKERSGSRSSRTRAPLPVRNSSQVTKPTTDAGSGPGPKSLTIQSQSAPIPATISTDGQDTSVTQGRTIQQGTGGELSRATSAVCSNETVSTATLDLGGAQPQQGTDIDNPIPQPRESTFQIQPVDPEARKTLWYSPRTPRWNEAIDRWQAESKTEDQLHELEKFVKNAADVPIERVDFLSAIQPNGKPSTKWRLRLKRCEPMLNAAKGVVMPLAGLDPHKVAPIICGAVFFGLNVLFNRMSPEIRDRILDILFGCGDTIRECISYEMHFSAKTHPAIGKDRAAVEDMLLDQYLRALRLILEIQSSCTDVEREFESKKEEWLDWIKVRGRKLWNEFTDKIVKWESSRDTIKRNKDTWASRKKLLEDKLAADDKVVKVQQWIRNKDDPEPSFESIRRRIMPDGRYGDAAQWLIDDPSFVTWCETLGATDDQHSSKRVLWLRGGYGTGKTTLLYHTYMALRDKTEYHPVEGKELRFIPYFCDASKTGTVRPTYETIVRALSSRLSLLPDFTLAEPALNVYNKITSAKGLYHDESSDWWEPLFKALIASGADRYHFVFLIDALDESIDLSTEESWAAEDVLKLMTNVMRSHPNISFLCSSHQQVRVHHYFGAGNQFYGEDVLQDVEVTATATSQQMEVFVTTELERRELGAQESVFYNPSYKYLQDSLRETLIENAKGMFRWVQVWLDILLPIGNDKRTIRTDTVAELRLKQLKDDVRHNGKAYQQLEAGYQRLWELNALEDAEELGIRTRLFHLVLCTFEPQTVADVSLALRVQGSSHKDYPTPKDVRRLCSNFLIEELSTNYWRKELELRFVHDSARKFVLNLRKDNESGSGSGGVKQFSDKDNHASVLRLYMDLFGNSAHPFWRFANFDPSEYRDFILTPASEERLRTDRLRWLTSRDNITFFLKYLSRYGLQHCAHVAEQRSLFDTTWTEVLTQIVLNPSSAFVFIVLIDGEYSSLPYHKKSHARIPSWSFLGQEQGKLKLRSSHALACLDIICEDDVNRLALSTTEADGCVPHSYFKDVACLGGELPYPEIWIGWTEPQKVTALQLACTLGNRAAALVLLRAAKLQAVQTARDLLYHASWYWQVPFCKAIEGSYYSVAATLLKYEKEHLNSSDTANSAGQCVSKQWSLPCETMPYKTGGTALHLSVQRLAERTLDLFEIAIPEDVNIRDHRHRTALHFAARAGFTNLVRGLVEIYGAEINPLDVGYDGPAFGAYLQGRKETVGYFGSKGVFVDFHDYRDTTKGQESERDLETGLNEYASCFGSQFASWAPCHSDSVFSCTKMVPGPPLQKSVV